MIVAASLLCLAGLIAFVATSWKAREVRRDKGRMGGYIASLKAVAADHRARIGELEASLAVRDLQLAAQERLLDGQAAHLRRVNPGYAG